jgi:hypothetical protein
MTKKKNSSANVKRQYCEIEPKECDGKCCYAKGKNKKGSR